MGIVVDRKYILCMEKHLQSHSKHILGFASIVVLEQQTLCLHIGCWLVGWLIAIEILSSVVSFSLVLVYKVYKSECRYSVLLV